MRELRIHDPDRRPASWAEIIKPGQFVAFATPSDGTCVLFDAPATRFDVFDAGGRAHPPLLTIVHPARAQGLDSHPRMQHKRRVIAWVLIACGTLVLGYTYWKFADIRAIVPGVIGINLLLAGGRLLWFNLAVRETERARDARVAAADSGRGRPT